jgi:hypothetical protein
MLRSAAAGACGMTVRIGMAVAGSLVKSFPAEQVLQENPRVRVQVHLDTHFPYLGGHR